MSRLGLVTTLGAMLAAACGAPVASAYTLADHARPAPLIIFQTAVPDGDGLYTMREDGTDVRPFPAQVPGSAFHPDWSPDAARVVFGVDDADGVRSVWIADRDGSHARELVHCGDGCLSLDFPSFSPDGRSVVFSHFDSDPPPVSGPPAADSIRIVDVSTGTVRVVARSAPGQLLDSARWSPSGRRLAVQNDRFADDGTETGSRILTIRVADGRQRPVTAFSMFAFYPDWSPNGRRIVFDTYDIGAYQTTDQASNLYTVRPDGRHLRQLTHLPAGGDRASNPTFTPDGKRILFVFQTPKQPGRSGRHGAFIDAHGGPIRPIDTDYTGPVTHPRLSPRGPASHQRPNG